jgi:hypothetical protein
MKVHFFVKLFFLPSAIQTLGRTGGRGRGRQARWGIGFGKVF